MNILPLVSAFLLVFSLGAYSFIHKLGAARIESSYYASAHEVQRKYGNRTQKKGYRSIEEQNLDPKKESKSPKKKRESSYPSLRDQIPPAEERKLSLASLLKEDAENTELYAIATRLFDSLYTFSPLAVQGEEILPILLQAARDRPGAQTLAELLPALPEESRFLFYKLLKGTQTYRLHTTSGYPPLDHYFTLKNRPPILACHAARPLLEAVFGPLITPQIILLEEEKSEKVERATTLNQSEFTTLLSKYQKNLTDYGRLLGFTRSKRANREEIFTDNKGTVHITLPIYPKDTDEHNIRNTQRTNARLRNGKSAR